MARQCSRPGCTEPAVAVMGYQYAQRVAWIDELGAERDPHAYDLCERHTARQSVPFGWVLDDRRRSRATSSADRLAG